MRARAVAGAAPMRRALAVAAVAAVAMMIAPAAQASSFRTGLTSSAAFSTGGNASRDVWFDRAQDLGVSVFRIDVIWASFAPSARPANPSDPASYTWTNLDDQVLRATQRGMDVMFTVFKAPPWAEGSGRASSAPAGTWKPSPADFAAFGKALARHYDGNHTGVLGLRMPRVKYYEAWNEPNLGTFLTPQWKGGKKIVSVVQYRKMLNSFYNAVHSVHKDNMVLAAGTAPYGDTVGTGPSPKTGGRTRPLQFYRELMCLKRTKNKKGKCPDKAKFDIAGVHPINRSGAPTKSARNPDDITTPDVKHLLKALRYAERKHRVKGPKHHHIWATEIWIETNPPDKKEGVKLKKASDWMSQTLYLLWKQHADTVINYRIQDDVLGSSGSGGEAISLQAGFWYAPNFRHGKEKKPFAKAFSFPFVSDRKSKKKLLLWGMAPRGGKLTIERKKGKHWKKVKRFHVKKQKVFKTKAKLKGKQKLRAKIGSQRSNVWKQKK